MNPEIFAEWLRRRGYRVVCSESSYWYEASPRVFQAFPFNWVIQPSERELHDLIHNHGMLAFRYSAPLNSSEGLISYHTVLNGTYSLDKLNSRARTAVRAGLKNFKIEPISFDRLADEGWQLQQETLDRQCRSSSMKKSEWEALCLSAKGLPGFEAWGATCNGDLAASEIAARIDGTVVLVYTQSKTRYLSKHVNNALIYSVCEDFLSQPGIKEIFLGLQSLDAPETVDAFKFQLGINPKPVRQRVVMHPLIKPWCNPLSYSLLLSLEKAFPNNCNIPKIEGMLRFFLQGKRQLDEQEWPKCLNDVRGQLDQGQMIEEELTSDFPGLRTNN